MHHTLGSNECLVTHEKGTLGFPKVCFFKTSHSSTNCVILTSYRTSIMLMY